MPFPKRIRIAVDLSGRLLALTFYFATFPLVVFAIEQVQFRHTKLRMGIPCTMRNAQFLWWRGEDRTPDLGVMNPEMMHLGLRQFQEVYTTDTYFFFAVRALSLISHGRQGRSYSPLFKVRYSQRRRASFARQSFLHNAVIL